jgi:hypothetical protein
MVCTHERYGEAAGSATAGLAPAGGLRINALCPKQIGPNQNIP